MLLQECKINPSKESCSKLLGKVVYKHGWWPLCRREIEHWKCANVSPFSNGKKWNQQTRQVIFTSIPGTFLRFTWWKDRVWAPEKKKEDLRWWHSISLLKPCLNRTILFFLTVAGHNHSILHGLKMHCLYSVHSFLTEAQLFAWKSTS